MSDDKFYEMMDAFIASAQKVREHIWAGLSLDAEHDLDQLILGMIKYKTEREEEEFETL